MKRITQLSPPHLQDVFACKGVFLSLQFIQMNAEMNYPCISELVGRGGCLIHSNMWMIAIHCDSSYEACTHPQKHPLTGS